MKWYKAESILIALWGIMLFLLLLNRPLSTVALIVLGIAILLSQLIKDKPKIIWSPKGLGIFLLVLLFMIYAIGYFRFMDHPEAWPRFEKKSPLLFIPLMWVLSRLDWKKIKTRIYLWLCAGILLSGSLMIVGSTINFIETGDWHQFFYHAFTSHIQISAIYYSLFLVIVLALKVDESEIPFSSNTHKIIRGIVALLLLVSASKLFVFLGFGVLFLQWLGDRKQSTLGWKQVFVALVAVLLTVPVLIRTSSLMNSSLEVITQDQYEHDTPINGLTLRLIQIRFGFEILNEEEAWLFGVGPALNKTKLDHQYKLHNMYSGNPELGDKGMLAYNYHNQWMETVTAVGLSGLFVLLSIFIGLLWNANFYRAESSLILVFAFFMFTESYLERQQGVVLFAFVASILFKPDSID